MSTCYQPAPPAMTGRSPHRAVLDELLALPDEVLDELTEGFPGDVARESPAEMGYFMAWIKVRLQDMPEQTSLYLGLLRWFPSPLDHCRKRAEDARWRRLDLKWRARQQPLGRGV
jgi:hypothetical protein